MITEPILLTKANNYKYFFKWESSDRKISSYYRKKGIGWLFELKNNGVQENTHTFPTVEVTIIHEETFTIENVNQSPPDFSYVLRALSMQECEIIAYNIVPFRQRLSYVCMDTKGARKGH